MLWHLDKKQQDYLLMIKNLATRLLNPEKKCLKVIGNCLLWKNIKKESKDKLLILQTVERAGMEELQKQQHFCNTL